ncbi:spore coat protein [Paenibacillus sp. JTLBN-2024]
MIAKGDFDDAVRCTRSPRTQRIAAQLHEFHPKHGAFHRSGDRSGLKKHDHPPLCRARSGLQYEGRIREPLQFARSAQRSGHADESADACDESGSAAVSAASAAGEAPSAGRPRDRDFLPADIKTGRPEYAWSAFECSTPQLRSFLENAFQMCSHQAFEVWQYMASRGYYAAVPASQDVLQPMQQMYKSVPEHQPGRLYS